MRLIDEFILGLNVGVIVLQFGVWREKLLPRYFEFCFTQIKTKSTNVEKN